FGLPRKNSSVGSSSSLSPWLTLVSSVGVAPNLDSATCNAVSAPTGTSGSLATRAIRTHATRRICRWPECSHGISSTHSFHAAHCCAVMDLYGAPNGRVRLGVFRSLNRPAFCITAPDAIALACGKRGLPLAISELLLPVLFLWM